MRHVLIMRRRHVSPLTASRKAFGTMKTLKQEQQ